MKDAAGTSHVFKTRPARVVCLASYITQMLAAFGQADHLAGLTRQDLVLHPDLKAAGVGSAFDPDVPAVAALNPDLVIASVGQAPKITASGGVPCPVMVMAADSLGQAFDQMQDMGRLFDCETVARQTVLKIKEQLILVGRRLDREKNLERKRVVRVMASDTTLFCPGDDSFQNEMIDAAGGVVLRWEKNGFAVPVTPAQWQKFNPQVVFGCDDNAGKVRTWLNKPGYAGVDAVKNGMLPMFPCTLTCRASTGIGDFVQWLSAVLYPEVFADPGKAVTSDQQVSQTSVPVHLPYVKKAAVIGHRLADADYKSLVLTFHSPLNVLSTLEGMRRNLDGCGNTHVPMAASFGHMRKGVQQVMDTLEKNLGFARGRFATLMTGADMDHLSVVEKTYEDLTVTVLATAGVRGNAMRMSKDAGYYFSHGTINIIAGANRQLSEGAMTRALITITEAKTAALSDLDIRSSYTPWPHGATGTGTDNVLVIQGTGPYVIFTGGHGKLAELMGKAVHEAVTKAIAGQNGIRQDRDIFQRLAERGVSLEALADKFSYDMDRSALIRALETHFRDPLYGDLIKAALTLSDARRYGLGHGAAFWNETCLKAGQRLCEYFKAPAPCHDNTIPEPLARVIGTLIKGIETCEHQTCGYKKQ
ncbi:adenosylcobinamide amidohydrolase [Desulfotignum balticum]|uniref:adenosylcobinamide amidohydrolase n=1 Tax=Desulfotignum balticum TaxID=115781 RepID=UPI0003F8F4CC|nr:adenosylcobinamide amidohydrolase [Desulfotignum balticum]